MRKIALTAMVFLLLIAAGNVQSVAADTSHESTIKQLVQAKPLIKLAVASRPTPDFTIASSPLAPPATPSTPAAVVITVQPGDTLSSIAAANNTTYNRLFAANDSISDPNVIIPGQQFRVPSADEQLPARPLPQSAASIATSTSTLATRGTSQIATTASYAPLAASDAKAFIYSHESGNNPNSTSPNGCYGLGQDCNGVVRSQCGADYTCQDAYFTSYALRRYGSWEAAASFWQTNHWW